MLPPQSMVKISVLFQLCAVAAVTLTASAAALGLEDDDVRTLLCVMFTGKTYPIITAFPVKLYLWMTDNDNPKSNWNIEHLFKNVLISENRSLVPSVLRLSQSIPTVP